jgi:hypothetical protein
LCRKIATFPESDKARVSIGLAQSTVVAGIRVGLRFANQPRQTYSVTAIVEQRRNVHYEGNEMRMIIESEELRIMVHRRHNVWSGIRAIVKPPDIEKNTGTSSELPCDPDALIQGNGAVQLTATDTLLLLIVGPTNMKLRHITAPICQGVNS